MYAEDSFFTLTPGGQAGLVALSVMLGLGMTWLTWALTRHRRLLTRVLLWAGLFTVFLWLSPQFHYGYYLLILDDLPVQWVIARWPDPAGALEILTFRVNASIANHARAGLGIAMLIAALAAGRRPGKR